MVSRHCNNINDKLCHNLHLAESLLLKERAFMSVTYIMRSAVSFCSVKPTYKDISNIKFYPCFLTYLYCQAQKKEMRFLRYFLIKRSWDVFTNFIWNEKLIKRRYFVGVFESVFSVLDCAHFPELPIHCTHWGGLQFVPSLGIVLERLTLILRSQLPVLTLDWGSQGMTVV